MTPFVTYISIAVIIAFVSGFFVGKRTNQQKPGVFVDSEQAQRASKKGVAVVKERIEKRKSRIMGRARREGKVTNDDVEDLFCISDATARNYLNELESEGKLTQVGKTGRGVYYSPKVL